MSSLDVKAKDSGVLCSSASIPTADCAQEWRLCAGGSASARVLKPRDSLTSRGASFTAPDSDTRLVIAIAKDFMVSVDEIGKAGSETIGKDMRRLEMWRAAG